MYVAGVLVVFAFIIAILAVSMLEVKWTWPIARPAVEATWPMVPGAKEGFLGSQGLVSAQGITTPELKQWLPAPEVLTHGRPGDEFTPLFSAASYEAGIGKPFKSYDLLTGGKAEPRVAIGPTAQQCYQVDYQRSLERAGSYAQRTNNFIHGYPDSCSAPNHDLVLDFYKEKPTAAPYQV
jgi:hypothetical protein